MADLRGGVRRSKTVNNGQANHVVLVPPCTSARVGKGLKILLFVLSRI